MSLDLLGSVYVGAYDMAKEQRMMNALKQVPVCVARVLLKKGSEAIDAAIKKSEGGFFKSTLPGGMSRDKVKWALKWHEDNLKKFTDPAAEYPNKEDLKKFVMMAYIEWNAADEGREYSDAINSWGQLWIDIQTAAAELPARTREAIDKAVKAATGLVPWWVWAGGVVTLGAGGYAVFKLLHAAAPAVGRVAAERYLPRLG